MISLGFRRWPQYVCVTFVVNYGMPFAVLVSDIITICRSDVDDQKTPYLWPDSDWIDYADDGQNEACRCGRLLVDSSTPDITTIPIVAGTALYALDPRVIFVRRAKLASRAQPLLRSSMRDFLDPEAGILNWEDHTGTVMRYITDYETGKIRLYRTPTANDTLHLTVVRLPLTPITSVDDELEIHLRFQRSLRYWMFYRAYSKQDADTMDPKKAADNLALFEREFGKHSPAIEEEWINATQGQDIYDGTF
jgi:hypothetical protein